MDSNPVEASVCGFETHYVVSKLNYERLKPHYVGLKHNDCEGSPVCWEKAHLCGYKALIYGIKAVHVGLKP